MMPEKILNDLSTFSRITVENVTPSIDGGRFPIKRIPGERIRVSARVFCDGHDLVCARIIFRKRGNSLWQQAEMHSQGNDLWAGEFTVSEIGLHEYSVEGWIDRFGTWQADTKKKHQAGVDIKVELQIGLSHIENAQNVASGADAQALAGFGEMIRSGSLDDAVSAALSPELSALMKKYPDRTGAGQYTPALLVKLERKKARFSSWYELFPRSTGAAHLHGSLRDCERLLPAIARMGFDVLYLPPVHPIGTTARKGKNNALKAESHDPGSPWAIGGKEGGHKALHPQLGTLEDFDHFVKSARELGLEIALDIAFQCSPDHPYLKEHPEWFSRRPDGSIQYAENPPKKYEDIVPFNFECTEWKELWTELRSVVQTWIDRGVHVFRVDNPHTKPIAFWEWLLADVHSHYPDVIFLAEAFTRPSVMYYLAKIGFSQSYTYFIWRSSKQEIHEYLTELTTPPLSDFFGPNFWPTTPDILPEILQFGGRPAFVIRLVLAATLSSSYGIYGPAYELLVDEAIPGKEEYLDAEKYEIKSWDRSMPGNLTELVSHLNKLRRENAALQSPANIRFHETENDTVICYSKVTEDGSNTLLIVVSLDPFHPQQGRVHLPAAHWGLDPKQPILVHDLLSNDKFIWHGEKIPIDLDPSTMPAKIFRVRHKLRREHDFDYYM